MLKNWRGKRLLVQFRRAGDRFFGVDRKAMAQEFISKAELISAEAQENAKEHRTWTNAITARLALMERKLSGDYHRGSHLRPFQGGKSDPKGPK